MNALEQQREDAALGAAWRRLEAAAAPSDRLILKRVAGRLAPEYHAARRDRDGWTWDAAVASTPLDAVEALTEKVGAAE